MGQGFYKSIKKVELNGSEIKAVKGSGKAKDFKKSEVLVYEYDDVFDALNIKRLC